MAISQKRTGRAASLPGGLAFGAAISLSITLLIAAILAKMLDTEKLLWENVGYGIMILLLTSSFMGAISAYGKVKRQRLMVCLLSGMVYFVIMLSITAPFFGGQYEAVGVTAALILAGSGTAGLLGIRENRGGKARKSKMRYR